jgi:hypothetical protein
MAEYIKEDFELTVTNDKKIYTLPNTDGHLEYQDFMILAKAIKFVIHQEFPRLNLLTKYLKGIANLMTDLDLAIP